MSKIHYFQRYSSPENTVTNNTLQLFARIYDYSVPKLDALLTLLLSPEETIGVGIEINQQTKGKNSIPDGVIRQRSFEVLVESKVGSPVDVRQLANHCASFGDGKLRILVLLTIKKIEQQLLERIEKEIDKRDKSIIFRNVTYQDVCEKLDDLFEEYEDEINGIVEDYKTYCRDTRLIDEAEFLMRIVPTSVSFDLNKKYALYFHPSDRGYSNHAYIGFYRSKAVESMMKVESVFDIEHEKGHLKKTLVSGKDTDRFDASIIAMISDAKEQCHYAIQTGHRFFCANIAFDTLFRKTTRGGILGPRFVNLKSFGIKDFADTANIAAFLKDKTWG